MKLNDTVVVSVENIMNGMIGEIGGKGYMVLLAILSYAEKGERTAIASTNKIADICCISQRTVITVIDDLVYRGYLKKEIVPKKHGGFINKYTVLDERFEV